MNFKWDLFFSRQLFYLRPFYPLKWALNTNPSCFWDTLYFDWFPKYQIFIQFLLLKKRTSVIYRLKSDQISFICSTQSHESRGQCGINLCDSKKNLGNILYLSFRQWPLNLRNLNLTIACHCRSTSWFQICLKFNCQLLIGNCNYV